MAMRPRPQSSAAARIARLRAWYMLTAGSAGGAAPAWTPESLSGLHTWLNGATLTASSPVTSWSNSGSAGAYTSAGTNRPTATADSPPLANYDGGDDYLENSNALPAADLAISFVLKLVNGSFEFLADTTNGSSDGFNIRWRGDSTDLLQLAVFDASGTFLGNGELAIPTGNRSLYLEHVSGVGWNAWVDESPVAWKIAPATVDPGPGARIYLGCRRNFSFWYSGSMLDVIIADRPADRTEWLAHLTTERGKLP